MLLRPFIERGFDPSLNDGNLVPEVNLRLVTRWLVNMQGTEIELGGFKGRTNKLVDACYSWWVGGCFPLLRALGVGINSPPRAHPTSEESAEDEGEWDDLDGK